jgi:hypothetical protein
MNPLNTLLKQAGVITPARKETEVSALLRDSPLTKADDISTVIAIAINTEEEIAKTRNAIARAVKVLPQWKFRTKLDKASLTLYVGKYERPEETTETTEVQPNL